MKTVRNALWLVIIGLCLFSLFIACDKNKEKTQEVVEDNPVIAPSLPDSFFNPPTPSPQDQKNIMKLDKPLRMSVLDEKEAESEYEIFIACTKPVDNEMIAHLKATKLQINTITGELVTARGDRKSIFAAMRLEIVRGMQLATQMEQQTK